MTGYTLERLFARVSGLGVPMGVEALVLAMRGMNPEAGRVKGAPNGSEGMEQRGLWKTLEEVF